VRLGGGGSGDINPNVTGVDTYTIVSPSVSVDSSFRFLAYGSCDLDIDNISVKEVKGGNDGTVSGSPETILLPEARNGRDTLGFPINNVNNGYLALHGDGYVEVADDASLDVNTSTGVTVECWYKTHKLSSGNQYIMLTRDGEQGYGLQHQSATDTLRFINGDTNISALVANAILQSGTWYHVVGTHDGATRTIYINGVSDASESNTDLAQGDTPFFIGKDNASGSYVNGSIDEPRIYSRALTEVEVLQNYNASKNKHRND
jgi:hypothetical protein